MRRRLERPGSAPLVIGEPAFGADEDCGWSRRKAFASRFASGFVGKVQPAPLVTAASSLVSATGSSIWGNRVRPHCSAASIAIASQSLELHAFGDGSSGQHREEPGNAELRRFLDQPVGLRALHGREGEPDVRNIFGPRVRRSTMSVIRFFGFALIRASHSPDWPSKTSSSASRPSRITFPR